MKKYHTKQSVARILRTIEKLSNPLEYSVDLVGSNPYNVLYVYVQDKSVSLMSRVM